MNPRGQRAWIVFGACLVLVGLALGWVTREVLALEQREAKASEDARVQQAVGLALWRMDSAFAPVLAQEAMRASGSEAVLSPGAGGADDAPPPAFRATFTIDAAGKPSNPEVAPYAARLKPAPLPPAPAAAATPAPTPAPRPATPPPPVNKPEDKSRLGSLRSAGEKRLDDAKGKASVKKDSGKASGSFDALEDLDKNEKARDQRSESRPEGFVIDRRAARALTPPPPTPPAEVAKPNPSVEVVSGSPKEEYDEKPPPPGQAKAPASDPEPQRAQISSQLEQKDEYQSRQKMARHFESNAAQNLQVGRVNNDAATVDLGWLGLAVTETGPLEPRWVAGQTGKPELFFVRAIRNKASGEQTVQGLWCDWPKLERWLVSFSRDLFVDARLQPAPNGGDPVSFQLATIPAWLAPPYELTGWKRPSSPTRLVLAAAWIAALGAIAAVGGVLKAALSLGERRGRFVSAVTHELRTPLTTFRMYSQMLADGMVPAESRAEYLATLRDESERLTRVVESVLLYSRLEEGRGGAHRERIAARALIDRILPALSKRAADGGMALATVIEVDPSAAAELDVQAVEQIVLNLVDNACKYAAPASDRLELGFRTTGAALEVRCRDWGPGIPEDEREAVFLPFRRGTKDAAGTTPGVGLGLALARGLARALGGDLVLDPGCEPGACFDLTIPLLRAG